MSYPIVTRVVLDLLMMLSQMGVAGIKDILESFKDHRVTDENGNVIAENLEAYVLKTRKDKFEEMMDRPMRTDEE